MQLKNNLFFNKINYFLIVCYYFFFAFLNGLIIKKKVIILCINSLNIFPILNILKYNLFLLCDSLIDITVVDYLNRKSGRFELNYIL